MTDEERREKLIEYCKTKTPCCEDGKWYLGYALKKLEAGATKMPTVYDVCTCLPSFGLVKESK